MKQYTLIFCLLLATLWLTEKHASAQDLKLSQWNIAYKRNTDILVQNTKAEVLSGKDLTLERAVETLF